MFERAYSEENDEILEQFFFPPDKNISQKCMLGLWNTVHFGEYSCRFLVIGQCSKGEEILVLCSASNISLILAM